MQSSQTKLRHNLTADDIDFIDHAIQVANFDLDSESSEELHEDYLPFQHDYQIKSFVNNLRHALTHPHDIELDDLGEILTKLPTTDCIALLDLRPALIKDIDALEYILANFINEKDRLFLPYITLNISIIPMRIYVAIMSYPLRGT